MLSPLVLATWISICTPWAEPRLLVALVMAGSGGEAFMVSDAAGQNFIGKTQAETSLHLRELKPSDELYIGLTQIPVSKLTTLGLHAETALDICSNLEIGYHLLTEAHMLAGNKEKSPWKRISAAYSIYRTGKAAIDSPFGRKATDYLMQAATLAPAPMNSPLRHALMSEWSSGLATRQANRYSTPQLSPLVESAAISSWARAQF